MATVRHRYKKGEGKRATQPKECLMQKSQAHINQLWRLIIFWNQRNGSVSQVRNAATALSLKSNMCIKAIWGFLGLSNQNKSSSVLMLEGGPQCGRLLFISAISCVLLGLWPKTPRQKSHPGPHDLPSLRKQQFRVSYLLHKTQLN